MIDSAADLDLQKKQMRAKLRFRRKHFVANLDGMARLAAFRAIPAPLAEFLSKFQDIGSFISHGSEPDIQPLLAPLDALFALPHHCARADAMTFRRWQPGDALDKGPWGTQQPGDDSAPAHPSIILCPMLGFDRQGGRLGQGGGHYDRYFAANPTAQRIGVAWSVQEVDAVPRDGHDISLNAVLTEQEFIHCGERA